MEQENRTGCILHGCGVLAALAGLCAASGAACVFALTPGWRVWALPVFFLLALAGSACGLLLYALRDLGAGLYNLGSGGAIGRGYVQVDRLTATLPDGRGASLTFDRERRCTAEDPEDIFKTWLGALEEERT